MVTIFVAVPGAKAQDVPELWLSSADPPEGTPIEALSPPDTPGYNPNRIDGEFEPRVTIKNQRIAGSALKPRSSTVDFYASSGGGCTYASSSPAFAWNTPIWLPQGSEVQGVRMYYSDTSANNSIGWFTQYDLYGAIVAEWGISSSGDGGTGWQDSAAINHEIDYQSYSYTLNWRPVETGNYMQLCGFRIFYEAPPFSAQFLPLITND